MAKKKTSRGSAKPVTGLKKKSVRELTEAEIRGVRGGVSTSKFVAADAKRR